MSKTLGGGGGEEARGNATRRGQGVTRSATSHIFVKIQTMNVSRLNPCDI